MSALELTLKTDPGQRIDLSQLTPNRINGMSEVDIANIKVNTNKTPVTVGDIFTLAMGDLTSIRFSGLNDRCDYVGDEMETGSITIDGNAGAYTAARMKGGKLEVTGNTGDYMGASTKGGHIIVRGNTGNYAGGRHHAENQGCRGATIHIHGNAGDHLGERMRRGIIIVGGDAGDYVASRIIAGTIIVGGENGRRPAYGMRRGTVVLQSDSDLLPTFADCGVIDLPILKMIKRNLETIDAGNAITTSRVRRFAGDMASLGKGEILVPAK